MKKVLYTDFISTEEIISEMMENKDFKKAITRSNLYKFWSNVAGEKFSAKSKPYSMIGGGVMVVACENTVVAQELTLRKAQILKKMQPYMKSLRISVKDIKFDAKKWNNQE